MALEVKLGQDLRLRQQLVMTPQLQQAIKILQLSLPELEAVVQAELEQNPMLEPLDRSPAESAAESESQTGEAPAAADAEPGPPSDNGAEPPEDEPTWNGLDGVPEKAPEQPALDAKDAAVELKELGTLDKLDWREYLENYSNNWQGGEPAPEQDDEHRQTLEATLTRKASLEDHLIWQLRLSGLSEAEQRIGAAIIYNLNDSGYFETPIEELAAKLETDAPAIERVLQRVQRFDPPGVAARDLRECLYLQLTNLGMEDSLAARIVLNHLDLLEKHR